MDQRKDNNLFYNPTEEYSYELNASWSEKRKQKKEKKFVKEFLDGYLNDISLTVEAYEALINSRIVYDTITRYQKQNSNNNELTDYLLHTFEYKALNPDLRAFCDIFNTNKYLESQVKRIAEVPRLEDVIFGFGIEHSKDLIETLITFYDTHDYERFQAIVDGKVDGKELLSKISDEEHYITKEILANLLSLDEDIIENIYKDDLISVHTYHTMLTKYYESTSNLTPNHFDYVSHMFHKDPGNLNSEKHDFLIPYIADNLILGREDKLLDRLNNITEKAADKLSDIHDRILLNKDTNEAYLMERQEETFIQSVMNTDLYDREVFELLDQFDVYTEDVFYFNVDFQELPLETKKYYLKAILNNSNKEKKSTAFINYVKAESLFGNCSQTSSPFIAHLEALDDDVKKQRIIDYIIQEDSMTLLDSKIDILDNKKIEIFSDCINTNCLDMYLSHLGYDPCNIRKKSESFQETNLNIYSVFGVIEQSKHRLRLQELLANTEGLDMLNAYYKMIASAGVLQNADDVIEASLNRLETITAPERVEEYAIQLQEPRFLSLPTGEKIDAINQEFPGGKEIIELENKLNITILDPDYVKEQVVSGRDLSNVKIKNIKLSSSKK